MADKAITLLKERKATIDRLRAKLREFEEQINLHLVELRIACPHYEIDWDDVCKLCGKKV